MLHGLLPIFESRQKTLVLRSWTVGVGSLGRLHVDPKIYETVLGDIDSPALIVSTKYTAGDFFSYLPLNPTLMSGRHRRLVELQARPEFEGFGAFPDFLGEEYARALRTFRAREPASRRHLHLLAIRRTAARRTAHALSPARLLALDRCERLRRVASRDRSRAPMCSELARRWARERDSEMMRAIGDAIANMLIETRRAVREGFYIRAFAEREVRVPGLELPPLMWIFEWDRVGGWHSLLSLVYRGTRDAVDASIAEGHEAAAIVRRQRERVRAVFAATAD